MKKSLFVILLLLVLVGSSISSFLLIQRSHQQTPTTTTVPKTTTTNPIKKIAQVLGVSDKDDSSEPDTTTQNTTSKSAINSPSSSVAPNASPSSNTSSSSSNSTSTPTPAASANPTATPTTAPSPSPTPKPTPTPAAPNSFDLSLEYVLLSNSPYPEDPNVKGVTHIRNNGAYALEHTRAPHSLTIYAKNFGPATAVNVQYQVFIDGEVTQTLKEALGSGQLAGERVVELPDNNAQHTVIVKIATQANTPETNPNNNSLKFIYRIKN